MPLQLSILSFIIEIGLPTLLGFGEEVLESQNLQLLLRKKSFFTFLDHNSTKSTGMQEGALPLLV